VASTSDLEAALQARWDLETLAVYADALIARGDPRGEVVALDLHIAEHGSTPELEQTRRDLLFAWLGGDELCGRAWRPQDFRFGLLEDFGITSDTQHTAEERVAALLACPAGSWLRGLGFLTSAAHLAASLELLATRRLPWLRRLSIDQVDEAGPVPPAIVNAFVAATPYLEELALEGVRVLASPVHPHVRTLRLVGGEALVVGRAAMPQVSKLELVLVDREPSELRDLAALVNPRLFPGLSHLDLSRNEYSYPTGNRHNRPVFPFVFAIEAFERVTQLRLPSVRSDDDARAVLELLARYPRLEVTIARTYKQTLLDDVDDPRLHVAPPRRWLPRDVVSSREALTITLPGAYGDELALASCIEHLERAFDAMAPDARTAWNAVWDFLAELGWEDEDGKPTSKPFEAATLLRALEALDDDDRCARVAQLLRAARHPPGATVLIKRYWGW
jgi:hypothetical protein